jgi:hypothetical protein
MTAHDIRVTEHEMGNGNPEVMITWQPTSSFNRSVVMRGMTLAELTRSCIKALAESKPPRKGWCFVCAEPIMENPDGASWDTWVHVDEDLERNAQHDAALVPG